ncbi:MAG: hypothetical protein AB8F34_05415 [Akkermansiaceae bacterium]
MNKKTNSTKKTGGAVRPLQAASINRALLKHAEFVLGEWLPDGELQGSEYTALNPTRDDNTHGSFKINVDTGKWSEFADDAEGSKGGDLIGLYRYLFGGTVKKNINDLSKFVREQGFTNRKKTVASGKEKKKAPALKIVKKAAPPAEPIKPEELGVLPPDMDSDMNPVTATYEYRNAKGEIVFYTQRVELEDGNKDVKPVMWLKSKQQWKWRMPQGPHPLYRGDLIGKGTTVLFGEGEKVADHLNSFLDCVGVTSVGGSGRLLESDLSSLDDAERVIVFPDGDEPGAKYAAQVAAYCNIYEIPTHIVDVEALKWTDGEDAADHPKKGMDDYSAHFLSFGEWSIRNKANRKIADTAYFQVAGVMDDAEYERQKKKISALMGGCDLRILKKNVDLHLPPVAKNIDYDDDDEDELTPAEIKAIRAEMYPRIKHIAEAPDIMELVQKTLHERGVVGEEAITSLTYLAVTSRLLENPVNPLVKGSSASGKSFTTQKTLKMFPEGAYHVLTGGSAKSLIYTEEKFEHRMLVILEASQLNGADDNDAYAMFLRTLLSEGYIRYETVDRDDENKLVTRVIEKTGPTGLILTTTADHIHQENETRMVSAYSNESEEQTKAIMQQLAAESMNPRDRTAQEKKLEEWLDFHEWISMGSHDVVIPFMLEVEKAIERAPVRLRRDFTQLISLIMVSAIIHQATRETDDDGRLIATLDDYRIVREVIIQSLQISSSDTLEPGQVAILKYVYSVLPDEVKKEGKGAHKITSATIGREVGIPQQTVSRKIGKLIESGYLKNMETLPKKPMRLKLGDDFNDALLEGKEATLPTAEHLGSV